VNADDYQRETWKFDNHGRPEAGTRDGLAAEAAEVLTAAVGLVAAQGGVNGLYEKLARTGYDWAGRNPTEEIAYELGDVLWNVANLAHALGYPLSVIMKMNLDKLTERYAEAGIPLA
jgi:NTP pyrophosphatase (non-canonical NTP hydrolase)